MKKFGRFFGAIFYFISAFSYPHLARSETPQTETPCGTYEVTGKLHCESKACVLILWPDTLSEQLIYFLKTESHYYRYSKSFITTRIELTHNQLNRYQAKWLETVPTRTLLDPHQNPMKLIKESGCKQK